MTDPQALLAAYDAELRTEAETPSAQRVTGLGPLRLVTFAGGRGFITYPHLQGAEESEIRQLVAAALAYYAADPAIEKVEWKTRGHDRAPGLDAALRAHHFAPEETESIMLGALQDLVADVDLPSGVVVRRVSAEADVRAMCAMQFEVFGDAPTRDYADAIVARMARGDGMELWVAEADGQIVSAGRLEPVEGSSFAGIWGGATRPEWRGRGIYRALTAARARSAIAAGKRFVHSDSTEFSRPILERAGLLKVSTTTPYVWRRDDAEPGL